LHEYRSLFGHDYRSYVIFTKSVFTEALCSCIQIAFYSCAGDLQKRRTKFSRLYRRAVLVVFTEKLCTLYRKSVFITKRALYSCTRDLQTRRIKETHKREVQKRGTKETYKSDEQKRRTKETLKSDVQKRLVFMHKRRLQRLTKETYKETYKRDLQKRPTKETYIFAQKTYKRIELKCITFYR